jgi:hypothetical protein
MISLFIHNGAGRHNVPRTGIEVEFPAILIVKEVIAPAFPSEIIARLLR